MFSNTIVHSLGCRTNITYIQELNVKSNQTRNSYNQNILASWLQQKYASWLVHEKWKSNQGSAGPTASHHERLPDVPMNPRQANTGYIAPRAENHNLE